MAAGLQSDTTAYKILLIGAGQIGSRHLQGLMKSGFPVSIGVVEPDAGNRETAALRARQTGIGKNIIDLKFWNSIEEISFKQTDIAIIATGADVRDKVIRALFKMTTVSSLILEKVVFQSLDVFNEQSAFLKSQGTKTLVNCPRRIYPFYDNIRKQISPADRISISVTGSKWGLGCNSLHFIDLLCYLTSDDSCEVDYTKLDPVIHESKRAGFSEFTGRIGFSNERGSLHLDSFDGHFSPVLIEIITPVRRWIIDESNSKVIYYGPGGREELSDQKFPFQSELTGIVCDGILSSGECGLTSIDESFNQHRALLPLFLDHIEKIKGIKPYRCPIT
jgi:hypothetical protein